MKVVVGRVLGSVALLAVIGTLRGNSSAESSSKRVSTRRDRDLGVPVSGIWLPLSEERAADRSMCHASDFSHIKKGRYGKISLDDLNLAMVGNLVDGTADRLFATLYLDQRATREQSDALFQIVQYMNTLANQPPVPFRNVKSVPIAFYESTNRTEYHVEIRNTLHEKALLRRGKSGRPLFSLAAMDLWSNTVHNADNVEFKYEDAVERERWDYSRHYANLKYFSVSKQMYVDEKMLGQHGNNSGKWTPRQLEIIQQGLEKEKSTPADKSSRSPCPQSPIQ